MDRVVRQARVAVALAISPDSMAPVVRSMLQIAPLIDTGVLFSMRLARLRDQLPVEDLLEVVVLRLRVEDVDLRADLRLVEQRREVEALAPSSGRSPASWSSICICPIISSNVR